MKRLLLLILYIWMSGSLFAQTVQTQRILSESGKLLGAQHVMVAGSPYTVMFNDGSCIQVFANCDPARFIFHDFQTAKAAGQILLDQVIVNSADGDFRLHPERVGGCDGLEHSGLEPQCALLTPYATDALHGTFLGSYAVADTHTGVIWLQSVTRRVDMDFIGILDQQAATLAIWTSESQPASATTPSTMDFNGDGKADILMRSPSGDVSILLMNSVGQAATTNIGNVSNDWKIMGSADFNSDGKSDILWRNVNGDMVIWLMNGTAITQGVYIGNVSMDWTVTAIRDFNGDGKADILWQNPDGVLVLWMMNGGTMTGSSYLGTLPNMRVQ